MTHWLTHLINNEGVCRKAPTTPGLLNKVRRSCKFYSNLVNILPYGHANDYNLNFCHYSFYI